MKKFILLTLVLALALAFTACGAAEKNEEVLPTQLGSSAFSIVLPAGYALTDDELDEDQVAYFYKDDKSIDFDVYQWAKGDQYTLEGEANAFAAYYNTVAEDVTVNGINGKKYITAEEYEGAVYTVVNYMFEDDTNLVELCFWTIDTKEEYAAVDEIIGTLKKN